MACSGVEVEGATASATARRRFIVAGRAFHHNGTLPSKQNRLGRSPRTVRTVPRRFVGPAQNSAQPASLTPAGSPAACGEAARLARRLASREPQTGLQQQWGSSSRHRRVATRATHLRGQHNQRSS